jgi:outer membrane protein OmpA-like peptidoglycan-associated protein
VFYRPLLAYLAAIGTAHRLLVAALLLASALKPAPAVASPWSGRANIAVGGMLSKDQIGPLHFDTAGFLAGAALSRKLIPWLSAQWWIRGGEFLAPGENGALMGTTLGLRVHSREREVMPYLSFDAGACLTGTLVRPWYGATVGVDWRVREWMTLGPVAGFDQVIQWNKRNYSTDAIYYWVGIGMAYDPVTPHPAPIKKLPPPVSPPEPAPEPPATPSDDRELKALIERTIEPSTSRLELLAPVLFATDSDQIEPIGVAMLYEVAHALRTRRDIRLLEVQGYADARGSEEHNQALSQRRAQRVRDWLIAHGVEPERLVVAAHGATLPVEEGSGDDAYEQNRRVIFRVLELAEP